MLRLHVLFLFSTLILFTQSTFSFEYKQVTYGTLQSRGLDFNSGSPLALTNGSIGYMGLFQQLSLTDLAACYLAPDGETIWTYKSFGDVQWVRTGRSTTGGQCAMIIPKPACLKEFYVFTI